MEAPEELFDSSRIHNLQGGTRNLDKSCTKIQWTNILEIKVLLYVDDALCNSKRDEHVLRSEIVKCFYVREVSVIPPTIYLVNKVSKITMENITNECSFISSKYA